MYAVIKAGGHQYRVTEGETLNIDRLPGQVGEKVKFDQVLMIGGANVVFGAPHVAGAVVEATIKAHDRAEKVLIFKYRRRKNYKRTQGHRQPFTVVEINKIVAK
jgi:large subunit ribosomal protein L21